MLENSCVKVKSFIYMTTDGCTLGRSLTGLHVCALEVARPQVGANEVAQLTVQCHMWVQVRSMI